MSYLNTPRLTFSGQFQADPSTVNNDPTHFNNNAFKPSFQQYGTADELNGWWNPEGTGNWKFVGCTVRSVTYLDGTVVTDAARDPIIGCMVMDTDARTAAKIVDLDTQQQMVSELWGLVVRLVSPAGDTLFRGNYKVAAFTNIWFNRSLDLQADSAAGAVYQSAIVNIQWNIAGFNSRYLNELFQSSPEKVSINFNVDRHNGSNTSSQFTIGRLAGAIGPTNAQEPNHSVLGRQIFPVPMPDPFGSSPSLAPLNFATGVYDSNSKTFVLDLGNAVQFNTGAVVQPAGNLFLAVVTNYNTASSPSDYTYTVISQIHYMDPDWYVDYSGICAFSLNEQQLALVQNNPIAIVTPGTAPYSLQMLESVTYVRADKFVYRLNPGDTCTVDFYVTSLGVPQNNQTVLVQDSTQLLLPPNNSGPAVYQPYPNTGTPPIPYMADNNNSVYLGPTNAGGFTQLSFPASDPGTPREYIDGQVYALSYSIPDGNAQSTFAACNKYNFVSLLVFSGNPGLPQAMVGWDAIQPIMQQYANLYPVMSKGIFNIANQAVVDQNAQILFDVFSKDIHDPNHMPATRDLSAYKKSLILSYLKSKIIG